MIAKEQQAGGDGGGEGNLVIVVVVCEVRKGALHSAYLIEPPFPLPPLTQTWPDCTSRTAATRRPRTRSWTHSIDYDNRSRKNIWRSPSASITWPRATCGTSKPSPGNKAVITTHTALLYAHTSTPFYAQHCPTNTSPQYAVVFYTPTHRLVTSLTIRREYLPKNSPETAACLKKLGVLCQMQHRNEETV